MHIDTWAPAQYVFGAPTTNPGGTGPTMGAASTTYDDQRHYKVAGTVIAALVLIFALRALGFRFVATAGVGR